MFIYCLFKWLISNSILLQQRISRRLVNLQIVAVACHRIHHNNPETGFYFQGVIPMCGKKGLELILKFCRHPFLVILGHSLIEPVYGKIGIIQWNWRITVTKICRYFWFNIIHTYIYSNTYKYSVTSQYLHGSSYLIMLQGGKSWITSFEIFTDFKFMENSRSQKTWIGRYDTQTVIRTNYCKQHFLVNFWYN